VSEYQRAIYIDGVLTSVDNRAVVLTFTAANYNTDQFVYVWAVDEVGTTEIDPRSEGERVVVVQHSVLSEDDAYNSAKVRNVEVLVRDNDTPGVIVTQIEIGGTINDEDGRTVVVEGSLFNDGFDDAPHTPTAGHADDYTGLVDEIMIQLAREITVGTVVIELVLDGDSAQAIQLKSTDGRFSKTVVGTSTTYLVTFGVADWNDPIRVQVWARDDFRPEDPQIAVIRVERLSSTDLDYVFPNLRSGPGLTDIEVIDNDSPGVVLLESGGTTLVELGGSTDDYTLRLTQQPEEDVEIAILTDGLTDIVFIDGVAVTPSDYKDIGGIVPFRMFRGNLEITGTLIERANGSDLGSFVEEGFLSGQAIRVIIDNGGTTETADGVITSIGGLSMTVTWDSGGLSAGTWEAATISQLITVGEWDGDVIFDEATWESDNDVRVYWITRADGSSWIADGFLEGQWIRTTGTNAGNYKIAIIRGTNATKDDTLELTFRNLAVDPSLLTLGAASITVNRIAAAATFNDNNWYTQQTIVLEADADFEVPLVREGVKLYPATTHILSKLRGPVAFEGGVTGADRSLKNGIKLPGEIDGPL
ncbi:MAG: hypothetical protein M3094_06385, partial [Actinomycetia bacterium]|nr:hypothetical protein [Actinomycetes bacterium]